MDGLIGKWRVSGFDETGTACSAKVEIFGLLPKTNPIKAYQLTNLYTLPRQQNKGYARILMQGVMQKADEINAAIILEPKSYGDGINSEHLQTWYGKLGFIVIQTKTEAQPCLMIRLPQPTTQKHSVTHLATMTKMTTTSQKPPKKKIKK